MFSTTQLLAMVLIPSLAGGLLLYFFFLKGKPERIEKFHYMVLGALIFGGFQYAMRAVFS